MQSEQNSNVINLAEVRDARSAEKALLGQPRRGRMVGAAGLVVVMSSLALGGYAMYKAVQLNALGDTVVLATLAVTGAYLVLGAATIKAAGWLIRSSRHHIATATGPGVTLDIDTVVEDDQSSVVPFRRRFSAQGEFTLRCGHCAANYTATAFEVTCPKCGHDARAG